MSLETSIRNRLVPANFHPEPELINSPLVDFVVTRLSATPRLTALDEAYLHAIVVSGDRTETTSARTSASAHDRHVDAGDAAAQRQKFRNAKTPITRKPKYGVTQSFRIAFLRNNLDENMARRT
ncbi:hypothetical protein [Cryobacterium sp. TMS1-13-1]|uniref:hypothetical protein n=1 Tax=Cryobacterium sp. TMS1-13-1 TaxID=1259220 RepID=UPI00106B7836|nr:hypothetical protein [Cryobacterium sp. TMS1-13-1]TFD24168.1 hypothetical protein E3T31_02285 [Cryobacterium sp. TMS1-13-1]